LRGVTVGILVIAITSTALAAEPQVQTNIYDDVVFRDLSSEQVTALIKRHMANLLYPVDLSSFDRPEKDEKFRNLIMALQKQMGVPPTGILTFDQFARLGGASRDINGPMVGMRPTKMVFQAGTSVFAEGTGAMDHIAYPINVTRIMCLKADGTCEMNVASFDHENFFLSLAYSSLYSVTTWTERRVTAIQELPCGTSTLSIDLIAKEVALITVPHKGDAFCAGRPDQPNWRLVDGFPVSWNINVNKNNKARELIYEPARKFFQPPMKPAER